MARPKGKPKKALTIYLNAHMVDELRKAKGNISTIIEEALMFKFKAKRDELDDIYQAKEDDEARENEILDAEVEK